MRKESENVLGSKVHARMEHSVNEASEVSVKVSRMNDRLALSLFRIVRRESANEDWGFAARKRLELTFRSTFVLRTELSGYRAR